MKKLLAFFCFSLVLSGCAIVTPQNETETGQLTGTNNPPVLVGHFIPVGQGNCVLIEDFVHNRAYLIDCGSSHFQWNRNQTASYISNELRNYAELIVLISHPDKDHYNFIPAVVSEVRSVNSDISIRYSGGGCTFLDCPYKNIPGLEETQPLGVEHKIEDNVFLTVSAVNSGQLPNQKSAVIQIGYQLLNTSYFFMLTGDADKVVHEASEAYLVENKLVPSESDLSIMLSDHHGASSHSSNSEDWLSFVKPDIALHSAKNGSYGHPRCQTISNYELVMNATTNTNNLECGYTVDGQTQYEWVSTPSLQYPVTRMGPITLTILANGDYSLSPSNP